MLENKIAQKNSTFVDFELPADFCTVIRDHQFRVS